MGYKEFAIDLARKAGEIMRQNFSLGMKKEWKTDNSPVTETDFAINKLVIEEVKKYFPTHNVKGEEESHLANASEYLWVCDPVDGTIPFSHGIPISTFSLALVRDGKSILGVIYDPFIQRLFLAEKNKGSYLNDQKISVSAQATLARSVINIECWKRCDYKIWKLYEAIESKDCFAVKLTSVAYSGMLVAQGSSVGAVFPHHTAHDIAAIKIIVEEAGGKVTDLFDNEQRYDRDIKGAIISNGKVHDILVEEVRKALNKNG